MDVVQDVTDAAVVVSAKGEIDSGTVGSLGTALTEALAVAGAEPVRPLVFDLDNVTYFGSAGLNAVVNAHEQGVEAGVAVRVVAVNPEVVRPIEVTQLHRTLRPFPSVRDALAADRG